MAQSRIDRMLDEVCIRSYGKLLVLTVAAAFAALVVAATSLTSTESTAVGKETPASGFVYFPSLHVNQEIEPTEHVQAF